MNDYFEKCEGCGKTYSKKYTECPRCGRRKAVETPTPQQQPTMAEVSVAAPVNQPINFSRPVAPPRPAAAQSRPGGAQPAGRGFVPPAPPPRPAASAPKFCPNCGRPNAGGKFCGGCGKQLI